MKMRYFLLWLNNWVVLRHWLGEFCCLNSELFFSNMLCWKYCSKSAKLKFKRSNICPFTFGTPRESGRRRGDRCPWHRRRKFENDCKRNGGRECREPLFATDQATCTGRVVSIRLMIFCSEKIYDTHWFNFNYNFWSFFFLIFSQKNRPLAG